MTEAAYAFTGAPTTSPVASSKSGFRRIFPVLPMIFLFASAWLIWYVAGHWNRWTGSVRLEETDDAYIAGDVTPLSARVSGYITNVAVNDYQSVHKDGLIAIIDPSDYEAQLALAEANLAAAQAGLANLANQRRSRNRLFARPRRRSTPPTPMCCAMIWKPSASANF
jgi:membrane fusion protein (multidrug efflux system)